MKSKDQPEIELKEELIEREDSAERLTMTAEAKQSAREKFRLIKNENDRSAEPRRRTLLPITPKLPPAA